MCKKDLKNRMVVEYRNGQRRMVMDDDLMGKELYLELHNLDDDLLMKNGDSSLDIVKVYKSRSHWFDDMFNDYYLELIWERKEVKELTIEEIEKELGYKIKVVGNDR